MFILATHQYTHLYTFVLASEYDDEGIETKTKTVSTVTSEYRPRQKSEYDYEWVQMWVRILKNTVLASAVLMSTTRE